MSSDKKQRVLDLIAKGKTHRQIAKEVGIGVGTVSKYRNEGIENDGPEEVLKDVHTDNGHNITYQGDQIITKDQFFDFIEFDHSKESVKRYNRSLEPVVVRVSKDETKVVNKWVHRLYAEPRIDVDIDEILSNLDKNIFSKKYKYKKAKKTGLAAQINIFDAHINKKSFLDVEWSPEIAYKTYMDIINRSLDDMPEVEEIVLNIGQDFFNSDKDGKTTRGTVQDNVMSETETYEIGMNIVLDAIDTLLDKTSAKITVIVTAGNHAEMLDQILGHTVKRVFKNNKRVDVWNTEAYRKYRRFGVSAVCFAHGHGLKKADMPMIFASEQPHMWAECLYKEVHTGHVHHMTVQEMSGLIFRTFSATTTTDKWHSANGYVGSIRGGYMILRDKELGNRAQFNYYI